MYKHILIAVDGSETSNLALKEGIKLAKEQKAALRLIPVVDETSAYMMVEAPYPIAEYQAALPKAGKRHWPIVPKSPMMRISLLKPNLQLSKS
jgi:nucleotide-binding universal stress UspA family protein